VISSTRYSTYIDEPYGTQRVNGPEHPNE